MTPRPANDQSGYTLVEVAVVMVVSSIVIGAVMVFAMSNLVASAINTARLDLQSEAQTALDLVNNDIRLAAVADEQNRWPDDNAPSNTFGWRSDGSTLVLATVAEDSEGNILFADPSNYISYKNNSVYFVQDGKLYKRLIAADVADNRAVTTCPRGVDDPCPDDRELLNNVKQFNVRYINGDGNEVAPVEARALEVSVQLETRKGGQTITADYMTRMVFRNG